MLQEPTPHIQAQKVGHHISKITHSMQQLRLFFIVSDAFNFESPTAQQIAQYETYTTQKYPAHRQSKT